MLPHYPLLHPSHKKVHSSHGVQDNFLPGPQTSFYVPSDLSQANVPNFSMKYFFLHSVFSPLLVFTFYLLLLWPKTTCSILSFSLPPPLSIFFFPAWMYDPAHRLNHLCNFFRHIVCYFFLSTYTMNYLAPMNISSIKLQQLIYLAAFLREYEVT